MHKLVPCAVLTHKVLVSLLTMSMNKTRTPVTWAKGVRYITYVTVNWNVLLDSAWSLFCWFTSLLLLNRICKEFFYSMVFIPSTEKVSLPALTMASWIVRADLCVCGSFLTVKTMLKQVQLFKLWLVKEKLPSVSQSVRQRLVEASL